MSYADECARVYRPGGKTTHLLPPGDPASSGHPESLCGIRNTFGRIWLGTGGQDEYDKAASLPLCGKCDAVAKGAKP